MEENIVFKGIPYLQKALNEKKISSVELVKAYIKRTNLVEKHIKSFIHWDEDYSLKQAYESDQRRYKGNILSSFDGIPITLKDNIALKNQRMTCGSKMLEHYISPYDATVVNKLKENGFIFWGKANLDEFAMGSSTKTSFFGKTSNPWNLDFSPGGSSGGSASSVASGQTAVSLGSDTGGSIRQPASYCGLVGLKPTYGLVSRYGLTAFASSLDQIGPLCRTVKDCEIIMNIIQGYDTNDSTSINCKNMLNYIDFIKKQNKFKIAILKESFNEEVDEEIKIAIEKVKKFYEKCGFKIEEISFPYQDLSIAIYYIIATAEAASNLSRYNGVRFSYRSKINDNFINILNYSRSEGFGAEVKRRILLGNYSLSNKNYKSYYIKAQKIRTLIKQYFNNIFCKFDAILSPTVIHSNIHKNVNQSTLYQYKEDAFTIPSNLAGIPSISIPCGYNKNGIPIGMQILANSFNENKLLSIASLFEREHEYKDHYPNIKI